MKTNKRNNRKTPRVKAGTKLVIIFLVLALLASGYLLWHRFYKQPNTGQTETSDKTSESEPKIDLEQPTDEQVDAGIDIKESDKNITETANFSVIITSNNINDELLTIRTLIAGQISNQGACVLTLINTNKIVTKTAKTVAMSSYSTCQGFDIGLNELRPYGSKWAIQLKVTVGEETATTNSEVTLE